MRNYQKLKLVVAGFILRSFRNLKVAATIYLLLTTYCLYGEGFHLITIKPRIISPASSKGMNDILIVSYENSNDSNVSGRILTINGSYIADMLVVNSDPDNPKITWNGKDGSSVVPSGIYIYQIEVEGQVLNGTVVVAK